MPLFYTKQILTFPFFPTMGVCVCVGVFVGGGGGGWGGGGGGGGLGLWQKVLPAKEYVFYSVLFN